MENKKNIMLRIYGVYFIILILAITVIGRIIYIQTVEDEHWESISAEQSIKYQKIKSNRGNIYSENHNLLATSIPLFDIHWDSHVVKKDSFFQNVKALAQAYHKIFPEESAIQFEKRMRRAFTSKKRYYLIRRKVDYAQLQKLKKLPIFRMGKYRGGMIVDSYTRRKRPYKMLAKRTIGNLNQSTQKYIVGLEGAYNSYLEGVDGVKLVQKTSGGWQTLNMIDETVKEPKNGMDIVSTIDINIQDVAENSLYRELKKHHANWGTAILMEVATGEVKAIVNLTHDTATDTYYEGYNYAIGTSVTPGSTFKLPSLMVALKDKKVKLDDVIHTGKGKITYYGSTMRDSHHGGYGDLTVKGVFEHSSNVGVFKIILNAYEANPKKFIEGIYSFGLQNPLGLQIKGEKKPNIKDTKHKNWSKLSLPWISIGYEITLTPMQILNFYNAVANNGVMVRPHFVKEIKNINKVVKKYQTEIINPKIAPQEVIDQAKAMCEGVITDGTATLLKNSPYSIGGKTGTAQIYKGNYDNNSYIASFVGYFPADKPKYSCMVVIYNPQSGTYYASQIAVPVFKDIADKIYATELDIQNNEIDKSIMDIPSSKVAKGIELAELYDNLGFADTTFHSLQDQWIYASGNGEKIDKWQREIEENTVPNVRGMTAKDATFLLESLGLRVQLDGSGVVRNQSIPPKTPIIEGRLIYLKLM